MTRNEEYTNLLAALEQTPAELEGTVAKALKRKRASQKKRRAFGVSALGLAACFTAFVLLVNLSIPFARACGTVPVLRELAKAVAWSPSLSAAVENDYVQPIGQTQTENGVTATVEYVIVDMKQLNIYYTLDSRQYPQLEANGNVLLPGERGGWSSSSVSYGTPNGELRSLRMDFIERDIPETLDLQLKVYADRSDEETEAPAVPIGEEDPFAPVSDDPAYLAEFTFPLELDPTFTAKGEIIPVDAVFTLDGRTVSITEAEVYPTHMRLALHTDPDNDAWLTGLECYLEDETGRQFRPTTNGILSSGMASGSDDSTVWLDSPYFESSRHLTLHITRAEWLDKSAPRVRLDLRRGTAENLPKGVRFLKAEELPGGWVVSFTAGVQGEHTMVGLFQHAFWDEAGQEHDIMQESNTYGYIDPSTGERVDDDSVFTVEFPLAGYHGDTAYLEPLFNSVSAFETPVAVTIK